MADSIAAYRVAAFADRVGDGSPTGVVLDADGLSEAQMQQITLTIGCSHTAFFTAPTVLDADVRVRFFTPAGEIKNCAHGTIAAHMLRSLRTGQVGTFRQQVASSVQPVEITRHGGTLEVTFRQDTARFSAGEPDIAAELLALLGISESDLDARYPLVLASPGSNRFLVALRSVDRLHGLKPQFAKLKSISERVGGIGCFAYAFTADAPLRATARMFAPAIGIDEDTINGNSSGCLGAYLLMLDPQRGEVRLSVEQGHRFNRPGIVQVTARRSGSAIETIIGGTAVVETELSVPFKRHTI